MLRGVTVKRGNKIFDTVVTAVFAAIIAVGAFMSLQLAAVPFTLQSFAVFLALGTIGWKRGTLSVVIYLILGLVGVPVFSGFKSGAGVLFGPTGGFLIGFIFAGLTFGAVSRMLTAARLSGVPAKLISFFCGSIVLYAFGCLMYAFVYLKQVNFQTLVSSFSVCVMPFLVPDALKITAAALISHKLEKLKIMKKYGI